MLYTSEKFDLLKDFELVARTLDVPLVVAASGALPVKDLMDFVVLAKKDPGQLNYASSGAGTIDHLTGALFATERGLKFVYWSYAVGVYAQAGAAGRMRKRPC